MGKVSTYLYFDKKTEEAFAFYKSVFGGEYSGEILRFGSSLSAQQAMAVPEDEKNLIMHIALPILDGHLLMGTDITESMSTDKLVVGNNIYITLEPESEKETERLFNSLSKNGKIELALKRSAWNSLHGVCQDPFGIGWILDFPYPS